MKPDGRFGNIDVPTEMVKKEMNFLSKMYVFKYKIRQNIDILIKSRNFGELKDVLEKVASIL